MRVEMDKIAAHEAPVATPVAKLLYNRRKPECLFSRFGSYEQMLDTGKCAAIYRITLSTTYLYFHFCRIYSPDYNIRRLLINHHYLNCV